MARKPSTARVHRKWSSLTAGGRKSDVTFILSTTVLK